MTTPTPRWTAETEELVARAVFRSIHPPDDWDAWKPSWHEHFADQGRTILTALADAGVLIPVGGETRQEWGWSHQDGSECIGPEGGCDLGIRDTRMVTEWPDGTELTTPWREVTDDPA